MPSSRYARIRAEKSRLGLLPAPHRTRADERSGRRSCMHGTIIEPTELPTRIAVSPGNDLSIASQHASAMSSKASPALALGERPYHGMSMAMQRNRFYRWTICYRQQDRSEQIG